jgi:uncharacterized membrane protein
MNEFIHSITIEAPPEQVFAFVSDIDNLPDYLPTVNNAEPETDERVRVQGEAAGRRYDSDGYFRVDEENMRIEWGSDGETNYSGLLIVKPNESSRDNTASGEATNCEVTVSIFFEPRPDQEEQFRHQGRDTDEIMREGIQKALLSIKNHCEGVGGKVESKAARQGKRR